jgi:hypothetical protein
MACGAATFRQSRIEPFGAGIPAPSSREIGECKVVLLSRERMRIHAKSETRIGVARLICNPSNGAACFDCKRRERVASSVKL